jgi:hypothetical protein
MAQSTLLSSSAGTFWGITNGTEWQGPLLLSGSTNTRTVTRGGSPATVVSAYSDDGVVNSVTVEDVTSILGSGTGTGNTSAAYFGFPLLKPAGDPVNLGLDQFTLDFFLEASCSAGVEDNNKAFFAIGINDGDKDFQTGRVGGMMTYNNASNPQFGIFYGSGGRSLANAPVEKGMTYIRTTVCTSAPATSQPFNWINTTVYGPTDVIINSRVLESETSFFEGGTITRPTGSNAHVFISIGRLSSPGTGAKNFTLKAYYKLTLHTFNDSASTRPG